MLLLAGKLCVLQNSGLRMPDLPAVKLNIRTQLVFIYVFIRVWTSVDLITYILLYMWFRLIIHVYRK